MSDADRFFLASAGFSLFVYLLGFKSGWLMGRDLSHSKRVRRDRADAEKMRAAIRSFDDRVEQFVTPPISAAQLGYWGEGGAEAWSTAIAPPPPVPRPCPRGPEA